MITMTPQARSVAAFTLATLLLTGHLNRLALAAFVASGQALPQTRDGQFALSLLTVVLAGAVLWFAHASAVAADDGWVTTLAQAARLLAVLGLVIAVLASIGALTSSGQAFYGTFSLGV
jgi:hypothetical protein